MHQPDRFVACILAVQRASHDAFIGYLDLPAYPLCTQARQCRGLLTTHLQAVPACLSCSQMWRVVWQPATLLQAVLACAAHLLSMQGMRCSGLLVTL